MRVLNIIAIALAGLTASVSMNALAEPPTLTAAQQEVWQGEINYWKYVNARDEQAFMLLWRPEFIGWPCGLEHPTSRQGVAQSTTAWFADNKKTGKSHDTLVRRGCRRS